MVVFKLLKMVGKRKSDGGSEPTLKPKVLVIAAQIENDRGFKCIAGNDVPCAYRQEIFNAHNFKRHLSLSSVSEYELTI